MIAVRVAVFALGFFVVLGVLGSAVRTVVLPRAIASRLTRAVFVTIRRVFNLWLGRRATYERRDRLMASYAPMSLLLLALVWLVTVLLGFTAMFWALEDFGLRRAFAESGTSLLTLGSSQRVHLSGLVLVISEAALGLFLLALLITFLPTLYSNFSKRETLVALLEVRAGSPPTASEMIFRFHRIHGLDRLSEVWPRWEQWFAEVEETHTSFPALVFFRSPQPEHSWINAAGTVLDSAALIASTIDIAHDPNADLCIRAGYIALRRIAAFFGIPFDPNPRPDDPISIGREEFEQVYDRFVKEGIPTKRDRDQAWRDFAGWRVNYDTVLLALAQLTVAPYAPWSSDRSPTSYRLPRILPFGRRSPS